MSAQELKVLHQPDEYALIEISALMAYPSEADEEKRRGLALRMLLTLATDQYVDLRKEHGEREPELSKHIGSWLGEVVLFHGGWPALANCTVGPGQKKSISDELWDRYKKGRTIGAVLGFALTRDLSIKAASELVCGDEMISIAKDILDTEPPYYDPRSIRHLWPTFKPVAHLWTAFFLGRMIQRESGSPESTPIARYVYALNQLSDQGLPGFVAAAEEYRKEAISRMPKTGRREPLLDPSESWSIR